MTNKMVDEIFENMAVLNDRQIRSFAFFLAGFLSSQLETDVKLKDAFERAIKYAKNIKETKYSG